ncbi:MAG: SLATT domain-containing protein [Candidatus Methylumidiphilus sp.]
MAENETLAYLEDELAKQIKGFDDSRRFFRSQHFNFTLLTALLSAMTTVLIGVGHIYKIELIGIISLVSSAAITVVAAWNGFLRPRELWIQKTDTWMQLQNIQAHIQYDKAKFGNKLTQDQIDAFYNRFDSALMGEHDVWKKVRSTETSQAKLQYDTKPS